MAQVPKASASNLTSAPPIKEQVETRIAAVNRAYGNAIKALDGGLFGQSDAERTAMHNVRQFEDDVVDWATRGRVAAQGTKPPPNQTWAKWFEQGANFIEGFHAQAEFDHETLAAFIDTAKEAPATTAKAVKKAATTVNEVGTTAALGILKPVAVALAAYVVLQLILVRR